MKLNFEEIKSITLGAESVKQESDGIHFYRFTEEQQALYEARNADHYMRSFATSGIRLRFNTNSNHLYLKAFTVQASNRLFFSFDIHIDGNFFDSLNNYNSNYDYPSFPSISAPFGEFEKEFSLPDGGKEICIYLPWSSDSILKNLSLDDGSYITPVKPKKKMLVFGDSITHGYDALRTSNKYISLLADYLDAEEFNKAIGGEVFFPELAASEESFVPDYITVAYGTNDWNSRTAEHFDADCKRFYKNLAEKYPHSKIFAIAPIWRKDTIEPRNFGDFLTVEDHIKEAVADYQNITLVPGINLVEHNENLYRDLRLHPNDAGFKQYFENLKKYIVRTSG